MKKIVIISSTVLSLILGIAAPIYAQENKKDKQDQPNQQQKGKDQAKPEQQHGQQQNQDRQQQQAQQQQNQNQDRQQQQAEQQRQDQNRQQEQRIKQQQNEDRQQQQGQQQQQRQDQSRQEQQRAQQQQSQERQQQQVQQPQQRQDQGRQEQQRAQEQQRPQRSQEQQRVWQSSWQNHRAVSWQTDHRSWQQRGGYNGYRIPSDRYRGYFGPQHVFRIFSLPFMVYNGYPRFQYEGYWITLLDPWPEYWSNDWYDNDDVYVDYRDDGYYMYNRRYPSVGIAINITM
jgi:hypothetical protein